VRFSGVSLACFGSLVAILLPLPAQPLASGPNPVAET
jgi:hypothetical protein